MRIEQDVKLDFKDVLIRPKRSTLKSRSEVSLTKTYTFRNCKKTWTGVPIMAANMDTTGTFTVAEVLSKYSMVNYQFHLFSLFFFFLLFHLLWINNNNNNIEKKKKLLNYYYFIFYQ